MNRGMAEDVFRTEDLSELLAGEAVQSVVAEVSGLAAGRSPRNRDELYELIRAHGSLEIAALFDRSAECREFLNELESERRMVRARLPEEGREIVFAKEDAELFLGAYPNLELSD